MLQVLLLSAAAGILGTGAGGLIGLIFKDKSRSTISCLLSFAAGVMLSIVFFDLIPEAVDIFGLIPTIFSIVAGVLAVWVLDWIINQLTKHNGASAVNVSGDSKGAMLRSGMVIFAAIALHNFPEGMAIGSGGAHSQQMGLLLAILIALHDIPEGVSIAVPLMEGGMGKKKAVIMTALSGTPTLLGGLAGGLIGSMGEGYVAASLGIAGGAMLYVTFCEILPQAILMDRSHRPPSFAVIGVLFGLIMVTLLS